MSFLAPLFLLGALAVTLPILFHLIRRTTKEKTPFSSLMFLLPTPPRVTKRSRIENLWLLILRCVVIGLLALGFARPFIQKILPAATSNDPGRKLIVLVDTSASMRRAGLWEEALSKADGVLKKATPADEVAVLVFDRTLRPLINFAQWQELKIGERASIAGQRLAALKPGWAASHLGTALVQAAELFDASGKNVQTNQTRQIVLISDLQEGSRLEGLQGHEWPRGVEIVLQPVKPKNAGNAGLHWLAGADTDAAPGTDPNQRFRVVNTAESKRDQLQLKWLAVDQTPIDASAMEAYVASGQNRVLPPPKPAPVSDAKLVLTGDAEDFDNTVFVVRQQPARLPVLFLGNPSETDTTQPLYYLLRAFQPTQRQIVEVVARKPGADSLTAEFLRSQLLIVAEALPENLIAPVQQFARDGKLVLVTVQNTSAAQTVGRLLGAPDLTAQEAGGGYAILAGIDFQHPLFAPFADPRFSDFTKIHFWKHRQIDAAKLPGARVLAKFDEGDPALLQVALGKGGVMVLTSGWQPSESQLALSSKFVPLLHSLLELSANLPPQKAQYFIGDDVPLPPGQQPFTVRKPDGGDVQVAAGGKFSGTDAPGIYTVNPVGLRFAVNVAPDESRTSPLAVDQLQNLGVPLKQISMPAPKAAVQQQARLQAAELEGRQKLWRWLIVAALVVLMFETWLAARTTLRGRPVLEGNT